MDKKFIFSQNRDVTPFQEQIEKIVTNGLGYEGPDPEERYLRGFRNVKISFVPPIKDTYADLKIHLAKMDDYKTSKELDAVMEEMGFRFLTNYDPVSERDCHRDVMTRASEGANIIIMPAVDKGGNVLTGLNALYELRT